MIITVLAFFSMFFQDIFGVTMMQYEALSLSLPERHHWYDYILGGWQAWRAAVMDQLGWMVGFVSTLVGIDAINGHNLGLKVAVILAISVANLLGSRAGQELGVWSDRRGKRTIDPEIVALRQRVAALESQSPASVS